MSDISCLYINTVNVLHNMHVKEAGLEQAHYILFQHAFFKLIVDRKYIAYPSSTLQILEAYTVVGNYINIMKMTIDLNLNLNQAGIHKNKETKRIFQFKKLF